MESRSQEISIVIPVWNEELNVPELYRRLEAVFQGFGQRYEVICVDDGSTDGTYQALCSLRLRNPAVKILKLSRNFGHQLALTAGLEYSSGRAVITMDGDLQHPPELIPELISHWRNGAEIVYTIRAQTDREGLFKRFTSRFFYRLMNAIANLELHDGAADFRLLDRRVVDTLRRFPEHSRFLRGLVSWVGFSKKAVEYKAAARHAGRTKFSFRKMLTFAINGIVSFSTLPLYLAFYSGITISSLAFLYSLLVLWQRFYTHVAVPGWASILIWVLFLGGFQLVIMGIFGLYIGRIYEEVRQRPLYIVQKSVGWADELQEDHYQRG